MRILIVYYSHSGTVAKVMESFCIPVKRLPGVRVVEEQLRPNREHPFPWRTVSHLFSVFPECQLGLGKGIKPLSVGAQERFDLVILAYQVWHLAPSLPVQDFLQSEYGRLLTHTRVVTVCVSRNMWHTASQRIKLLLRDVDAVHVDNVVVTHKGPPMATFVSVPRLLLFGRRDRLWGLFPAPEISDVELARVENLGTVLAERLGRFEQPPLNCPMLDGRGAVHVNRQYILAERMGARIYYALARLAISCERFGLWAREVIVNLCILFLFVAIVALIPLSLLLTAVIYAVGGGSALEEYATSLAQPSGEEIKKGQRVVDFAPK